MDNLEYLEKLKKDNFREFVTESGDYREHIEGRKVIALEIIAEELTKHNDNSGSIVTALENIDTTLNRR